VEVEEVAAVEDIVHLHLITVRKAVDIHDQGQDHTPHVSKNTMDLFVIPR
jgi:hypothetical protein